MDYTLENKLQGFRQIAQEKLQAILCSIPDNKKDLVIEPDLIKNLEHICGASWLRAKGINKIYKFDEQNPPIMNSTLMYLISSNLLTFKYVLNQINELYKRQKATGLLIDPDIKFFHIIVFPNVLHSFEVLLEEEGLYGIVGLHRFNWDFISMDTGLLSLEIPQLYRDLYMRSDTSLLSSIAHSFRIFNMIIKRPKMILTYGENSEKIFDMIDRIENSKNAEITEGTVSDFSAMLIIDRNKDYPSCLLTPVVYSGLLLEIFELKAGTLKIDVDGNKIKEGKLKFLQIKNDKGGSGKGKDISHLRLNGTTDAIYQENRYKHFSEVVNLLTTQSRSLGMETKNLKDMKLSEMKNYVSENLPKVVMQKKELFKHLLLSETIVNELGGQFDKLQTMEECMLYNKNKKQTINRIHELLSIDAHKYNALRQICLLHVTCGISEDEAAQFMNDYLNTFGYKYLSIFFQLINAKLFPELSNSTGGGGGSSNVGGISISSATVGGKVMAKTLSKATNITLSKWQNQFQLDANKIKLLPSEQITNSNVNRDPICPSYVFNGSYIPFIAQISRFLLLSVNFDEFSTKAGHIEQLKLFKYFNKSKRTIKEIAISVKRNECADIFPMKPRTIFIYIVGGVTYAELAACNLIEKITGSKIVIGSDAIICGSDIMEAATC